MTLIASHAARIADLANGTAELDNPEWWAQLTAAYAYIAGTTAMLSQADLGADEEENFHDAYQLAFTARRAADGYALFELSARKMPQTTSDFAVNIRKFATESARFKFVAQTRACAMAAAHCLALIEALEH